MAELPSDVVRNILGRAELGTDACVDLRKHGAVPKKLVIDPKFKEELESINTTKLYYAKEGTVEIQNNDYPIIIYHNPNLIALGMYVEKIIDFTVELYENKVIYTFKKYINETFEEEEANVFTISEVSYDMHSGDKFDESYSTKPDYESWVYDSEEKSSFKNLDPEFKERLDNMFKHRAFVYKYKNWLPCDKYWKAIAKSDNYIKLIQFTVDMCQNKNDDSYAHYHGVTVDTNDYGYCMIKKILNLDTGEYLFNSIIYHNIHTGENTYPIDDIDKIDVDENIPEVEYEYLGSEPERSLSTFTNFLEYL